MDLETRCLTLDERLGAGYAALSEPPSQAAALRSLWVRIALGGREDLFHLRLQRDGLDEREVLARMGPVVRLPGYRAPDWLADAEAVMADVGHRDDGDGDPAREETAFGPVLAPLVSGAEMRLISEIPQWLDFPAAVRRSARRQLWQSLADLLGLPLYESFDTWRKVGEEPRLFDDFVDHMRDGGFATLIDRYPVLARLCGVLRRRWIGSYGRFAARLVADHDLLESRLGAGTARVVDLRYGLSDPHGEGDCVLELRLQDGGSLFYKPRSLATDDLVASFVERMALPRDLRLRTPRHLDRGDYGWVLGVTQAACSSRAEVGAYYRRAGAWLGCLHLLGATDMHMENLIASGSDPVPIDFETILQAVATRPRTLADGEGAHWAASHRLETSVLSVGLLPGYMRGEAGATFSVGGLEASRFDVKRLVWSGLNTAAMTVSLETQPVEIAGNLPQFDGSRIPLDAHRGDVLEGLARALRTARQRRPELCDLLEAQRQRRLSVRRIIRPTRFYYLLLRRLTDHRVMSDGVTWGLQAELIARLYDWDDMETQPWKLFRAEREALYGLSIPAFNCECHRTVANDARGAVTNLHAKNGLDVALRRIESLDEQAIDLQLGLASAALGVPTPARRRAASGAEDDVVLSIARHLEAHAIREARSAAWLGLEYLDHRLMSQVIPVGHELYNGQLGIALFLAAAARSRGDERAFELATHAIAPIKALLRSRNRHRLVRTLGIGGYLGIGSLVYGLSVCSPILKAPDTLEAAQEAAALITREAARADDRHDLMAGAAGAILGLLKLHAVTGDEQARDRALMVADELLAKPRPAGAPWSSAVFDNQTLTGLSHGASGYALAFARLADLTGRSDYRDAAEGCLAFEDKTYDASERNWRDTRPESFRRGRASPNQWCYGAVGIGHARLAMGSLGHPGLSVAIDSVLHASPLRNDTLCCGGAGRADFLIAAGRRLNDERLIAAGQNLIDDIQSHWRDAGDARWDMGDKNFNLGLMRGVAGLGYGMLRSEDPSMPDVLTLS